MDIDLIIKILSIGTVASIVTGIFSVIVSIKNNKKLLQIEKQRERFSMDQRRYELIIELLEEIENIQFIFQKEGRAPDESLEYLSEVFGDSLEIYKKIAAIHKKKSYLLDDSTLITAKIEEVDESITEYLEYCKTGNTDDQVIKVDKICVSIYYLLDAYKDILRKNIEKLLKRT